MKSAGSIGSTVKTGSAGQGRGSVSGPPRDPADNAGVGTSPAGEAAAALAAEGTAVGRSLAPVHAPSASTIALTSVGPALDT
jgi:hypothetical protein